MQNDTVDRGLAKIRYACREKKRNSGGLGALKRFQAAHAEVCMTARCAVDHSDPEAGSNQFLHLCGKFGSRFPVPGTKIRNDVEDLAVAVGFRNQFSDVAQCVSHSSGSKGRLQRFDGKSF